MMLKKLETIGKEEKKPNIENDTNEKKEPEEEKVQNKEYE